MSRKSNKRTKNTKQYSRKDLMKLSSKELQKICKKNKYKTNSKATKMELVNLILTQTKVIATQNSNILTPSKKGEYLSSGYVRNHINSISKHKYDHQLSVLIGQYIGNIFMCFDIFHPKYIQTVKSNGKVVERGNYKFISKEYKYGSNEKNVWILYASSCGMDKGIHEWKIKVIKNATRLNSEHDIVDEFGVINKIKLCTRNENFFHKFNDWASRDHSLFTYNFSTDGEPGWTPKLYLYLKEKDVIKIILDCNQWILTFEVNGKLDTNVNKIKLKPNCKYYPVILSRRNKSKYKLI